jgi:uncharacterized NAD-dependent epimerase/dehydratase family protein
VVNGMIKVAFIDSGIDGSLFPGYQVRQFSVSDKVCEETPHDQFGHGTSMMSVFSNSAGIECEILSYRAGGDAAIASDKILARQLVDSIRIAVSHGANIINVSMGISSFRDLPALQAACDEAYRNNCLVVAAAGNESSLTMPFCCGNVLKVSSGIGIRNDIALEDSAYGCPVLTVNRRFYHVAPKERGEFFSFGNSACAAYVTALVASCAYSLINSSYSLGCEQLIEAFMEKYIVKNSGTFRVAADLLSRIPIFCNKPDFLNTSPFPGRACILAPFSKEMSAILRFPELTKISVVACADSVKKGYVGKNAYELSGVPDKQLTIVGKLNEEHFCAADSIVIGYVDEIGKYDSYFCMESLLELALRHNLNVFSFMPVRDDYKKLFSEKNLTVTYAPVIDVTTLSELTKYIPYLPDITKPVLGVFGTSSNQGKFTLQLLIRSVLNENGIAADLVGSEHHSSLLGCAYVYPCGYGGGKNIVLNLDSTISWLSRYMVYIDQFGNGDIMMVSGQSWLLPNDIMTQSAIQNMAFLEATRPDAAVVVVNPYIDHREYIRDTIMCLERIYKCRVVALFFSDKTPQKIGQAVKNLKLTHEQKRQLAEQLQSEYGIMAGCITDKEFVRFVVRELSTFFS